MTRRNNWRWGLVLSVAALCGCQAGNPGTTDNGLSDFGDVRTLSYGYAQDHVLRINHIQMKGTHNSYHVEPPYDANIYPYSHDSLDVQLDRHGVRQLELDVHYSSSGTTFTVLHVPNIDEETTCLALVDCLQLVRNWSDAHPGHHPLVIMIEPKDDVDPESISGHFDELDSVIRSVWPDERILLPDDVQGARGSLYDAVRLDGWPTLGQTRGMAIFSLLDGGDHRDEYTRGGTSLSGRVMFAEFDPPHPLAAIVRVDNPDNADEIRELAGQNLLVRTRADTTEAGDIDADSGLRTVDWAQQDKALQTGAHMISTDFPAPGQTDNGYYLDITGGTPSRCNPLTAPQECQSGHIESANRLRPAGAEAGTND